MSDIRLRWDSELAALDMVLTLDDAGQPADIELDDGLETSVLISLFTDQRAAEDDTGASPTDLRGWWADEFADVPGDQIGSRLWRVIERGLLTPDFEARVSSAAEDSLAWMIADGIAETVTATVTTDDATNSGCIEILITRPDADDINLRYAGLWEAQLG